MSQTGKLPTIFSAILFTAVLAFATDPEVSARAAPPGTIPQVFKLGVGRLVAFTLSDGRTKSQRVEIDPDDIETFTEGTSEDFDKYVMGVLKGEFGGQFGSPPSLETAKALAVAVRTYASASFNERKHQHVNKNNPSLTVDVNICDTIHHQVWQPLPATLTLPTNQEPYKTMARAIQETHDYLLFQSTSSTLRVNTFHFNSTQKGFTSNSNEPASPGFGNAYYGMYRRVPSPENAVGGFPQATELSLAGHGVGMSQTGALILAEGYGRKFEEILKHYFGPMPPIVQGVELRQRNLICYNARWKDPEQLTLSGNQFVAPVRELQPGVSLAARNLADVDPTQAATLIIDFSEQTQASIGPATMVTLKIDGTFIGLPVQVSTPNAPPERWTVTLPSSLLMTLNSGLASHTLGISAVHRMTGRQLDPDPASMAYKGFGADQLAKEGANQPVAEGMDMNHAFLLGITSHLAKATGRYLKAPASLKLRILIFRANGTVQADFSPAQPGIAEASFPEGQYGVALVFQDTASNRRAVLPLAAGTLGSGAFEHVVVDGATVSLPVTQTLNFFPLYKPPVFLTAGTAMNVLVNMKAFFRNSGFGTLTAEMSGLIGIMTGPATSPLHAQAIDLINPCADPDDWIAISVPTNTSFAVREVEATTSFPLVEEHFSGEIGVISGKRFFSFDYAGPWGGETGSGFGPLTPSVSLVVPPGSPEGYLNTGGSDTWIRFPKVKTIYASSLTLTANVGGFSLHIGDAPPRQQGPRWTPSSRPFLIQ